MTDGGVSDDGSSDATLEILREIAAADDRVRVVGLFRNVARPDGAST